MTAPTNNLKFERGRFQNWATVVIAVLTVMAWNGLERRALRRQEQVLDRFQRVDAAERKLIEQLDFWRNDADEKVQQMQDDQNSVEEMYYRVVQAPDDFFVVYPDLIVCRHFPPENNRYRTFVYLPMGNHELGVHVGGRNLVEQGSRGGTPQELHRSQTLEGGRVYEVYVSLKTDADERSVALIEIAGHASIEIPLPFNCIESQTLDATEQLEGFVMPGQIIVDPLMIAIGTNQDSSFPGYGNVRVGKFNFSVVRQRDGRPDAVAVDVLIESDGPHQSLPVNKDFHDAMYSRFYGLEALSSDLKYDRRGWYFYDLKTGKSMF